MQFFLYVKVFIISLFLSACSASTSKRPDTINTTENKNVPVLCSSSDARSAAFRRLWKLYGKEDIRLPYKVKSKQGMWDVYGYRNKAPQKTVHVIIPKADKNCAVKQITHESRKVCTLIGCGSSVKVNLLNPLKSGIYSIKIKIEGEEIKIHKISVKDGLPKNCKKVQNLNYYYSLLLNTSLCRGAEITTKLGDLSSFIVIYSPSHTKSTTKTKNIHVEIINENGIALLDKSTEINFNKSKKLQPNGVGCEPICYKTTIEL